MPYDPKRKPGREFVLEDVKDSRIICNRDDLIYDPPEWMRRGLQETASGYGNRLNSGYLIRFGGKTYRIYVTCFSNSGACWFKVKGERINVSAH